MEEIIKVISDVGVTVLIVALFAWRTLKSDKINSDLLNQIHADHITSDDRQKITAETIELLRQEVNNTQLALTVNQTMTTNIVTILERHDTRSEQIFGDMKSALALLQSKHEESQSR